MYVSQGNEENGFFLDFEIKWFGRLKFGGPTEKLKGLPCTGLFISVT